ncbi:hypothetical protein [Flavobacterium gelidilacus]|uniref:hypothetical protein n=1 Tax=Flavobacterium gelidilacus TaxID=206041 RepID=UPI001FE18586|nr:hypothetical protein [Flavobacterium gelidilacus]|tara:strand:+ start:1007 stop:1174 length:168 start_codon:yes stop_codon:yes gene_type:complete
MIKSINKNKKTMLNLANKAIEVINPTVIKKISLHFLEFKRFNIEYDVVNIIIVVK